MLLAGKFAPRKVPYEPLDAKATDMTPWKYAVHTGVVLLLIVAAIYIFFADFSSIDKKNIPRPQAPLQKVLLSEK